MTTRVRRRRPMVPPRKGRQPLPQFGVGVRDRDIWHVLSDIMFPRPKKRKTKQIGAVGDAIDWSNMFLGMIGVPPAYHIKKPKQKGGRFHLPRLPSLSELEKQWKKQRGGNLVMRKLMMASQPKIFRRQCGAGLFSIFTQPLARLFGKKVTKQAAKAVAKRVAKKAAK